MRTKKEMQRYNASTTRASEKNSLLSTNSQLIALARRNSFGFQMRPRKPVYFALRIATDLLSFYFRAVFSREFAKCARESRRFFACEDKLTRHARVCTREIRSEVSETRLAGKFLPTARKGF